MRLWRIVRAPYQSLDGGGARLNGGRWNSEGNAVVYLAATPSLAILELLVHVDVEDLPSDLILLGVDVPDSPDVPEIRVEELPPDWNAVADHPACRTRGDAWIASSASLLLRVPSAVSPRERNYVLNPAHPDATRATVASSEPFTFDRRLLQ